MSGQVVFMQVLLSHNDGSSKHNGHSTLDSIMPAGLTNGRWSLLLLVQLGKESMIGLLL